VFSHVRDILHVPRPPYRLFDGRAADLGPYYVTFALDDALDERHPIALLQLGLEQHARWKRMGDESARESFLAQALWAARAQRETPGGFRSAMAYGEAISLLLRAYQETGSPMFADRAIDASVPLIEEHRDGGSSHVLCGWICGLWALLELSRTAHLDRIGEAYRQSLATLERYLPSYDSGEWSYDNLLATPAGLRPATVQRHLLHVAQLNVLVSMTSHELFAVVAERWRRYGASFTGRLRASIHGLLPPNLGDVGDDRFSVEFPT
jgi:hypothetical protein